MHGKENAICLTLSKTKQRRLLKSYLQAAVSLTYKQKNCIQILTEIDDLQNSCLRIILVQLRPLILIFLYWGRPGRQRNIKCTTPNIQYIGTCKKGDRHCPNQPQYCGETRKTAEKRFMGQGCHQNISLQVSTSGIGDTVRLTRSSPLWRKYSLEMCL